MEKSAPPKGDPPIIENHLAPEIYVSQIARCDADTGGAVRLTFVSNRADSESPTGYAQVVNLRLVLSPPMVQNMLEFVGKWLASTRAINAPAPADSQKH
jgi:hypothetical protein